MQELLVDELTGDQVILAPARALRPDTFRVTTSAPPHAVATCPFCPGNEHETPPEVARLGDGSPDTPGWRVRVVPNKFPIVGDEVGGAHEVVILSPAHDADLRKLTPAQGRDVFVALRDRARVHLENGHRYVQSFVNHGKAAGASIEHPHAQLVALDVVPPRVEQRAARFTPEALARDQEHCVVADAALVWCPRASTSPFVMRVAVPDGGPRFEDATDAHLETFAGALHVALTRLAIVVGDAAYNVVVESAPPEHDGPFSWWADVVPRLGVVAGFEAGSGLFVNIVAPAAAAAALRDAR